MKKHKKKKHAYPHHLSGNKKHRKLFQRDVKNDGMMKIVSPIDKSQQFYVATEQADDAQIANELIGTLADKYAYSFEQEGKKVTGLSTAGVREVVRHINKNSKKIGMKLVLDRERFDIKETEQNGQKGIQVVAWALDMITGMPYPGTKFEPYVKTGRKGTYANTFALEKATSKAIRNAFRGLFPEKVVVDLIAGFEKKGQVKQLTASDLTPAATEIIRTEQVQPSTPAQKMKSIMQGITQIKDLGTSKKWLTRMKETDEFTKEEKKEAINMLETKIKLWK